MFLSAQHHADTTELSRPDLPDAIAPPYPSCHGVRASCTGRATFIRPMQRCILHARYGDGAPRNHSAARTRCHPETSLPGRSVCLCQHCYTCFDQRSSDNRSGYSPLRFSLRVLAAGATHRQRLQITSRIRSAPWPHRTALLPHRLRHLYASSRTHHACAATHGCSTCATTASA